MLTNRMSLVSIFAIAVMVGGTSFAEQRIISINFTGNASQHAPVASGEYRDQKIGYAPYAVKGSLWIDCDRTNKVAGNDPNEEVESFALMDSTQDSFSYLKTKLYLCSAGIFWNGNVSGSGNAQMLHTYLDQTANAHSGFKLTGLPFSKYTVAVYFGADGGIPIPAYQINGKWYKGAQGGSEETVETESWGTPYGMTTLEPGINTLIVTNLTDSTLQVTGSLEAGGRGRISGFQIIGELIAQTTDYSAELSQSATWSAKEGFLNPSGNWQNDPEKNIILTNNVVEPISLTFDEQVQAAQFTIEGGGTTILQKSLSDDLGITAYDLSEAERTVFQYSTGDAAVSAGKETVFGAPGSGDLFIKEGRQAVWSNMTWRVPEKIYNKGVITLIGGTEASPLVVTNSRIYAIIGKYHIAKDSYLKSLVSSDSSYFVEGESANESTFLIYSPVDWGMVDDSKFANVKLKFIHPSNNWFWINSAGAIDDSVWVDVGDTGMILNRTAPYTFGGLSGSGKFDTRLLNGVSANLTIAMKFGPTTFSGSFNNIDLTIGGTDEFTLTKGRTKNQIGSITIKEGANLAYQTDEEIYLSSPLKGQGRFSKQGTNKLTLAGDNSEFKGSLLVRGGKLVVLGKSSDLKTYLAGNIDKLSLLVDQTNSQVPALDILSVPQDNNKKIRLDVVLRDDDFLDGKRFKIMKFGENVTDDNFEVHVFKNVGLTEEREPQTYDLSISEGILSIRTTNKIWSGSIDGNGSWSHDEADLCWNDGCAFFEDHDAVSFVDIAGKNPSVSVLDNLDVKSIAFRTESSFYTFNSTPGTMITLDENLMAVSGDTIFNVPINTKDTTDIQVKGDAKLTLGGLFGTDLNSQMNEALYSKPICLTDSGTLVLAPGNGNTQKIRGFKDGTNQSKLLVSNGTVVSISEGGPSGSFGDQMKLQVNCDGTLVFDEKIDASGYRVFNNPIVINEGGELNVKVRDSLSRGLILNGGTLAVSGFESGFAMMFLNTVIQVNTNSLITALPGGKNWNHPEQGTVDQPVIGITGGNQGVSRFIIRENAVLSNAVTYVNNNYTLGGIIKEGDGTMVQNGQIPPNGTVPYPLTYNGKTVIKGGTYELNCEHRNENGAYEVHSGCCLCGAGSITGDGAVILGVGGGNAKLSGGLSMKNLHFNPAPANLPMQLGELIPISAKVEGTLTADTNNEVNVALNHGTFTIGSQCDASGFKMAKLHIGEQGILGVEAGGHLYLTTSPVFAESGSTIRIGANFAGDAPVWGSLHIAGSVDLTGVAFEVNVEAGRRTGRKVMLLTAGTISNADKALTTRLPADRKWKYVVETEGDLQKLYAQEKDVFVIFLE